MANYSATDRATLNSAIATANTAKTDQSSENDTITISPAVNLTSSNLSIVGSSTTGSLTIAGDLNGTAGINASGFTGGPTLTFTGALTQTGGFTVADASRVTLSGSYNATPSIILSGGGLFTNQGSVNTNQGTVNTGLDAIQTSTTASTTIGNAASARIVGGASGVIQVQGGVGGALIVNNAGLIQGVAYDGVTQHGTGALNVTNAGTGVIYGQNAIGSQNGYGVGSDGRGALTLTNAAGGTIVGQYGVVGSNAADQINNAGTIASGSYTAGTGGNPDTITPGGTAGVRLSAGGTVTNLAGGSIRSAGQGIDASGVLSLTNAGTISSTTQSGVFLRAGGTISNTGTGAISGQNGMDSSASAAAITVIGNGTFTGAAGFGIRAQSSGSNVVLGTSASALGVVSGTTSGIIASTTGAGTISIVTGGAVTGSNGNGISATGVNGGVTVNHTSGIIQATNFGIDASSTGSGAIVVNQASGQIGKSDAPVGRFGIYAVGSGGGTVDVRSGTIVASERGVVAINSASGDVTVATQGDITTGYIAINAQIGGSGNVVATTAARTILSANNATDSNPNVINAVHSASGTGTVQVTNAATITRPGATIGGTGIFASNGTSGSLNGAPTAVSITNTGTITNNFTTGISASAAGTGSSAGAVTVSSSGSIAAQTTGISASNSAAGTVSVSVTSGTVVATGTNSTGIAISGGNTGNAVTVSGATTKVVGTLYGVDASSAVAVTNAGTIASGSFAGNDPAGAFATGGTAGIQLRAGGTVTNQAGGVIDSGGRGVSLGAAGTIDNQLGGTIRHTGTVSRVDGDGAGVFAAANLTLTNAGTITTAAVGNNDGVTVYGVATITNSGLIQAAGASGIAIAGASSSITNSGTIQGGTRGDGVNLNNGGAILNQVGGTIQGGGNRGITSSAALTLTNLGTISGATDGVGLTDGPSSILNAGTIRSSTNYGVAAGGTNGATLSVTNATGGTITGGSSTTNGYGLGSDGQAMTVNNYGSIGGQVGGIIALNNLTLTANLYAGSVTGSIRGSGGNDTVSVYTGTVNATALIQAYTDPITRVSSTVTLQNAGTVAAASVGTINLGTGTNTLNLRGTGDGTTANGAIGTIAGVIAGTTAVNKEDAGTFVLSGANTYSGATTVSAGTLLVNGSLAAGSAVTVGSGAILGGSVAAAGTGTIAGTVAVAGTISAGTTSTVGTLNTGALSFSTSATFHEDVTNSLNADRVNVNGTVTLAGLLDFSTPTDFAGSVGQNLILIANDATDAVVGRFTSLKVNATNVALSGDTFQLQGHSYLIDYRGGDGNDVAIRDITPGPQPTPITTTNGTGGNNIATNDPNLITTAVGTTAIDTVIYSGNQPLTLPGNVENVVLSGQGGNATIRGNDLANAFVVQSGSWKIDGGSGNDVLVFNTELSGHNIQLIDANNYTVTGVEGTQTVSNVGGIGFAHNQITFDFTTKAQEVIRLYDATLHRAVDLGGGTNALAQINGGVSLSSLAQSFLNSTEGQTQYAPTQTNRQFVEALYTNVLKRAPEAAGAANWEAALGTGTTRGTLLAAFSESAEHSAFVQFNYVGGIAVDHPLPLLA